METLKERLLTGWTLRRALGGAMGLFVAIQAIVLKDALLGAFSAFFLIQIAANIGCFSSAGCGVQINNTTEARIPTKKLDL